MLATVIIRTYNEARYLDDVLTAVAAQKLPDGEAFEVVIVDSGSTDETLQIAARHQCRITHIDKSSFTFGRSLNIGCAAAQGDFLVMLSGHCIPTANDWLTNLIAGLRDGQAAYSYGRQIGRAGVTKFSEERVFAKNFPARAEEQLGGIFCNNANAAIAASVWRDNPFDEQLTGLEDMATAKQLRQQGLFIAYAPEAVVEHIHHESLPQIKTRYEREALALQEIMPEVQVRFIDFCRYTAASVFYDLREAVRQRKFWANCGPILIYRFLQYWGSYRGHNNHRKLSREQQERYFYPR